MRVMIDLPDELAAWFEFWQRPEIPMDAPLRRKLVAVLQEAHDDWYARLDAEADQAAQPSAGPREDDDLPF